MADAIEYALMAGRAYQTTREEINWLPDLQSFGWTEFFHVPDPTTASAFSATAGFEAISFQKGKVPLGSASQYFLSHHATSPTH